VKQAAQNCVEVAETFGTVNSSVDVVEAAEAVRAANSNLLGVFWFFVFLNLVFDFGFFEF
jgi:hypothetical protein